MRATRSLAKASAATAIASFMILVGAGSAHSDALGTVGYGGMTVSVLGQSVGIPQGALRHEIVGKKFSVTIQDAQTITARSCYPRHVWVTRGGNSGQVLTTTYTSEYQGCKLGTHESFRRNFTFPSNTKQGCAQIRFAGSTAAQQCHYIS